MQTSNVGLNMIVELEGLRLKAYPDPATGGEPWTIGVGHTSAAGSPKVSPGMVITRDEVFNILASDLKKFEAGVSSLVKVPVTQGQFDALISFSFNVGLGNFKSSTLLKKLNARDYNGAALEFRKWTKANGRVLAGLVKRRQKEENMFRGTG